MTCPNVDIFYDSAWNVITDDVRGPGSTSGGGISITRGRRDESSAAEPTNCDLVVANIPPNPGEPGPYSVRNPESPLYGKLGRSTPARVYLGAPHPGAPNSDTNGTTSHVAPSVNSPTDDAILICGWGCPGTSSYSSIGPMTGVSTLSASGADLRVARQAISTSGATGTRTATYGAAEDYVAASVLLHGTGVAYEASDNDTAGAHSIAASAGDWMVLIAYFGWDDEDELAAYLPDYPHDHHESGWMLLADTGTVAVADPQAENIRMKAWARRVKVTRTQEMTLATIGATLSTLVRVSGVGQFDIRTNVEVPGWPNRQDDSCNDRWIPVSAVGVTQRLERNQAPAQSAARRAISNAASASYLVGYWPMEDGSQATEFASGLESGGAPLQLVPNPNLDLDLAAYEGFRGSLPLPTWTGGEGYFHGDMPFYADGESYFRGLFVLPSGGLTDNTRLVDLNERSGARWRIRYRTGGDIELQRVFDGVTTHSSGSLNYNANGQQFILGVDLTQDGAALDWTVFLWQVLADGSLAPSAQTSSGSFASVTHTRIRRVGGGGQSGHTGLSFGHWRLLSSYESPQVAAQAFGGHLGEAAAQRFLRLCRENSVAVAVVGDPADDVPIGYQRTATFSDLLEDMEAAGAGTIYEPREFRGLAYRTLRSRYNQPAVVTLDHNAGQVAGPWVPTPDNFLVRNDVTVERYDGSSVRVTKDSGPLNTADPETDPEAVGRFPDAVQQNVMSDAVLLRHANWRLREGTIDEPRYPGLRVDLAHELELTGDAALVAAVAALDVGDRVVVTNPPDDEPPEDISQVVLGTREELLSDFERVITLLCQPEQLYHIAEIGHEDYGMIASASTTLNEALTTTETLVDLHCGAGADWVHEADWDIMIGGERMTVTAVGAASGTFPNRTQTITVTRSVNGIVKTHSTGDRVDWFHAARVGL